MEHIMFTYDRNKIEEEVYNDPRCYDDADVIENLCQEYEERGWCQFVEDADKAIKDALGMAVSLEKVLDKYGLLDRKNYSVFTFSPTETVDVMVDAKHFISIFRSSPTGQLTISYTIHVDQFLTVQKLQDAPKEVKT